MSGLFTEPIRKKSPYKRIAFFLVIIIISIIAIGNYRDSYDSSKVSNSDKNVNSLKKVTIYRNKTLANTGSTLNNKLPNSQDDRALNQLVQKDASVPVSNTADKLVNNTANKPVSNTKLKPKPKYKRRGQVNDEAIRRVISQDETRLISSDID
jgi:LAS superfamily LD-carboxypeptidase LdcB